MGAIDGGAGAGGIAGAAGAGGAGGDAGQATCTPWLPPACDAAPPDPGPARAWRDALSLAIVLTGFPNHRGRDLFLLPGDAQWIIGKFAYGLTDKDLKGEDVDVYLLRDCAAPWVKLGSAVTSQENEHPGAEGVDDSGGRIFFRLPESQRLGVGRHRVRLVVAGDLSHTELFIEVVAPGTPTFVSDIDGTLTTTENEEFTALLTGAIPGARPDAATALHALTARGYRPLYLTARPEFLVGRTREFLAVHGFPPGIVHTTLGLTGALGAAAVTYKATELEVMGGRGLLPAWAIGNSGSDADAYAQAAIGPAERRIFVQYDDVAHGGRRIDGYAELLPTFGALPNACP